MFVLNGKEERIGLERGPYEKFPKERTRATLRQAQCGDAREYPELVPDRNRNVKAGSEIGTSDPPRRSTRSERSDTSTSSVQRVILRNFSWTQGIFLCYFLLLPLGQKKVESKTKNHLIKHEMDRKSSAEADNSRKQPSG
jgi:hypothetical protein